MESTPNLTEHVLTQAEIDALGIRDAIAGDIATADELASIMAWKNLGEPESTTLDQIQRQQAKELARQNQAPAPDTTQDLINTITAPENVTPIVNTNTAPLAPAGAPLSALRTEDGPQDLPAQAAAPAASQGGYDPFANMSKTQRHMLGFAAISDAGAALAGRQGGKFNALLNTFSGFEDIDRKRKAAQARQAMMSGLMGGAGGLMPEGATVQDLQARRQQLIAAAMADPSGNMANAIRPALDELAAQIESLESSANAFTNANLGLSSIDYLLSEPESLDALTSWRGTFNEFMNQFGLAPEYGGLMAHVNQIQGVNFMVAYQSLKGGGQITEIESKKATDAQSRIDTALKGNTSDLMAALKDARSLFQEAIEKNPNYRGPDGSNNAVTWDTARVGDVIDDNGVKYEYIGGDKNAASSWKRVN